MNENGDLLKDINIKPKGGNKWEVTYKISGDGMYVISVLLDGGNWAKIKWDITNHQNNYRWGAEGAYDLMVVPQQ